MTSIAFRQEHHPEPTTADELNRKLADPGFGRVFSDHMVTIRYTKDQGWHDAKIGPRGALALDPATAVLHYAQEIFEGLKAFRLVNGGVGLFRPESNAARFNASAERLAMPQLPGDLFVRSLHELIRADVDWVPDRDGGSLYLRPFMFASEAFLGVRPSNDYLFVVIASPVGSYFRGGLAPISVWVSERLVRATPGGTGAAKCGGNYAASLLPHAEALANGCDQVLFLDAVDRRWIEELGGMNLFFVLRDGTVITPPLSDTILAGITRDSLLTLLRDRNVAIREERYSLEQLRADAASGNLAEAFACGTAAVVAPIGRLLGRGFEVTVADGLPGELTGSLRAELVALQWGERMDSRNWLSHVF